jgi:NhaP-type Na+/H+ or K+/H+ antiporter
MSEIMKSSSNWKTRSYAIGAIGGAVFGLIVAVLYARAAEEDAARDGKPPQIPTTALIGLALSGLGLARQIAEAGRPKK